MNVKQNAKKITAVTAGTLTVAGLTLAAPAVSADLSDYPEPFVVDGTFDGSIVVGEAAATDDVVGAIDIAASLQADSVSPVDAGGETTVEGGELIEENFNDEFGFGYDYRHLEGFANDEFSVDGTTFRYREHFVGETDDLNVETSLERGEDYGADPYLTTAEDGSLKYYVEFRNRALSGSHLHEDDGYTAEFQILGQDVEVLNVDGEDVTLEGSTTHSLTVGEEVEVDGRTVTLRNVGESSVIVEVDGESNVIQSDSSDRFGSDNYRVEVDSIFYEEAGSDNNMAVLRVGDELRRTVSDGEPAVLFGEVDDRREASWVWHIEADAGEVDKIGVRSNQEREDPTVTRARDRPALGIGDSFYLPNEYAGIEFTGLQEEQYELNIDLDNDRDFIDIDDYEAEGEAVTFDIEGGDFFEVDGFDGSHTMQELTALFNDDIDADNHPDGDVGEEYDYGIELWYFDGDEEVLADYDYVDTGDGEITFTLELDNDEVDFTLRYDGDGFDGPIESYFEGEEIAIDFDMAEEQFGSDDDAQHEDLVIDDGDGGDNYGREEYDILTSYGVTIEDPRSQFDSSSGSFNMWIPQNEQVADVSVLSHASTTTTAEGDAYMVNRIGVGIGALDSEVTVGNEPLLSVGGPRANEVSMELLGNPSDEEIDEMFEDGQARIELFSDQNALMVAGWSAQDTVRASYVLAQYDQYDLTGDVVELDVTSEDDIEVTPLS